MATSGTFAFRPVTDDVLTEAYERCGLSAATLNADIARSAKRSLQLMLLDWANQSIPLWRVDRKYAVTSRGVATYAAPPDTVDVLEVSVSGPESNYLLQPIGRDEWATLPQKDRLGRPTQYWTERQRDTVVLHLWPTPDSVYSLAINRFRQPEDVGGLGQSADVPVQWSEALTAGLAMRLAVKYAPDRLPVLGPLAERAFQNAMGEDRERVPLTILPSLDWR